MYSSVLWSDVDGRHRIDMLLSYAFAHFWNGWRLLKRFKLFIFWMVAGIPFTEISILMLIIVEEICSLPIYICAKTEQQIWKSWSNLRRIEWKESNNISMMNVVLKLLWINCDAKKVNNLLENTRTVQQPILAKKNRTTEERERAFRLKSVLFKYPIWILINFFFYLFRCTFLL